MAEMKYEDSDQLDVGYDDADHRHHRKPTNVLSQLEKSEVGRAKEQQTFISAVSNNLAIGINDVNKKYFNFCLYISNPTLHAHHIYFLISDGMSDSFFMYLNFVDMVNPMYKLASVAAISTISHLHDRALQAEKVKQNKEENERKQKEALENEEDTRPLFAPGEMDHVHDTVISKPLSSYYYSLLL